MEAMDYIFTHVSDLDAKTYNLTLELLNFMEAHPVPDKNKEERIKMMMSNGWTDTSVKGEYVRLVDNLYNHYDVRNRRFGL